MKSSLYIPLTEVGKALRRRLTFYAARELCGDMIAGLTVAVMGVPQAMAYALISRASAGLWALYRDCNLCCCGDPR